MIVTILVILTEAEMIAGDVIQSVRLGTKNALNTFKRIIPSTDNKQEIIKADSRRTLGLQNYEFSFSLCQMNQIVSNVKHKLYFPCFTKMYSNSKLAVATLGDGMTTN